MLFSKKPIWRIIVVLIKTDSGSLLGGPLDIMCIMKLPAGTYHVAFFEERPFPGKVASVDATTVVRLRSRMHYTDGAETLEIAQKQLRDVRQKLTLPDENVVDDAAIVVDDPVAVWIVGNWTVGGKSLKDHLGEILQFEPDAQAT